MATMQERRQHASPNATALRLAQSVASGMTPKCDWIPATRDLARAVIRMHGEIERLRASSYAEVMRLKRNARQAKRQRAAKKAGLKARARVVADTYFTIDSGEFVGEFKFGRVESAQL